MFRFRQMRMVFKAGDLLRRFIEAAPVLQAIFIVSEVTSDAASTGVADLEAAPEVTQTDGFYNNLSTTGLQAFSSMYSLTIPRLRNAIAMVYSDGASRFCRPFRWRGTARAKPPSNYVVA